MSEEFNNVYHKTLNHKSKGVKMKSPENRLEKTKRRLKHILDDTNFFMSEDYREFVTSMHDSIGNRKVTPKMEISMDKVISVYKKNLKSDNKLTKYEKEEFVNTTTSKILLIKTLLNSCDYQPMYIARSEEFLDSVHSYVSKTAKISLKQKKALNQMYKRFKKKLESKGIHDVQIEVDNG